MSLLDNIKKLPGKFSKQPAGESQSAAEFTSERRSRPRSSGRSASQLGGQGYAPFSTVNIFYYFLFALLFLALYLGYLLMRPFWHTIILACIFSALCHPVYAWLRRKTGLRDYLASGLTLGLLVLLICVPLVMFLSHLIPQATKTIKELASWLGSAHLDTLINERIFPLLTWVNNEFTWIDIDVVDIRNSLMNLSRTAGQRLVSWGTGLVFDSISIFVNFILMILIMFFLLKDGESMLNTLRELTPLSREQEENILQSLRRMANAVLIGGFSVAALQGFIGGIGLAIAGIPPLFWGTVMAAAALVPVVGTGLVWVPAVVYLLLIGKTGYAVFLLLWCGLFVTTVDSLLRPIIMRGSSKISLLFLFMSIFGGIQTFGALGIIYGPMILSFVLAMLSIYSSVYGGFDKRKTVKANVPKVRKMPRKPVIRRSIYSRQISPRAGLHTEARGGVDSDFYSGNKANHPSSQ